MSGTQKQPRPNYPTMSGIVHPQIYSHLVAKHKQENICWPIIAYDLRTQNVQAILFEVSQANQVNSHINSAFFSSANYPEYKLDYTAVPRSATPVPLGHKIVWAGPKNILSPQYNSSYEFVTKAGGLNTLDFDYAWRNNRGYFGLETTTFFMDMKSKNYAEYLIRQVIQNRWSRKGAHQLNVLAKLAKDIGINMSLVFFSVLGHTNTIITNGYAYIIPLTVENAAKLHSGVLVPGDYMLFSDWISLV